MEILTREHLTELEREIENGAKVFNDQLKKMTDDILTNDELINKILNKLNSSRSGTPYTIDLPEILLMFEQPDQYPGHNLLKSAKLHTFTEQEYFKRFLRFWRDNDVKVSNYQLETINRLGYKGTNAHEKNGRVIIHNQYVNADYTQLYFQEFTFKKESEPHYFFDIEPIHSEPKDVKIN